MIEVIVAALIVALIAGAVFTGFSALAHVSGGQRHEAQANELAQQDEEWLRGLNVVQLAATSASSPNSSSCGGTSAGLYGNECYTKTIDGETYTIASTAQFVTASSAASSCTASGTGSADYIETASTVTWLNNNDGRPAVTEHSLVSPHTSGALIIQVQNGATPTPGPAAGVTITVQGTGTSTLSQSLTTDANGCAVFAGLTGGTYTVSWGNYINESGANSASVVVVDGTTTTETYEIQQAGAISAHFTTSYTGATGVTGTDDTFVASNPQLSSAVVSGTTNSYSSTGVSTGTTLFPFSGTNSSYSVYAGYCTADAPPSPVSTTVTPGATSSVTVPEPAMLIDTWGSTLNELDDSDASITYYSGSTGHAGSASTDGDWYYESATSGTVSNYYYSDAHYDGTAGDSISYTFTGTAVEWLEPTSSNYGYANVKLDGTTVATNVSGYSATASNGSFVMYSVVGLTNTTHTLTIVVDGTKPSGSSGTYVAIDAIIAGNPTYYNNNNAALTYTGSWTYATYGTDYAGDETYSNTTGNKVTLTFTGNGIQWIGSYASNHGYASVSLDGGTATSVDTYAAQSVPQAVLYSATGLTQGSHTLTITVKGTKDSGSSGYFVSIDALIVGTTQLLSTAPDITLTDTGCANHETRPPTQVPTASAGALTNPGEPYGTFTVCADTGSLMNTATVANTNFTTGNTVNVYLYGGVSGASLGTCT
jgi:Tfp pilus assembly protein PilE